MRYALVKNNVVINIAVWDGTTEINWGDGVIVIQSETLNIGDTYE